MMGMSGILELLKGAKVEWKRLGEVCVSISTGLNPRKNFKLNDRNTGELTSWYVTTKDYSLNEKIEFVEGKTARITSKARALINKRSKLEKNDILFSAIGTVGKIAIVEVEPNNFDVSESTFVLKPNKLFIFSKYLVHYLRSDFIQKKVRRSLKKSTLSGLRKNSLENLLIPIPSLEVQKEIARILDAFAELTAELTLRKKQYRYYLEKLLSEEYLKGCSEKLEGEKDRNLRVMTLGEIGKFIRGNGLQKKILEKEADL